LRCRGDTHATTKISWPSAANLAEDRRLRNDRSSGYFGRHMTGRISRWAYLIVPTAAREKVDPFLVAGVMRVESNGDPLIWNLDSDARGLMQVLHAPFQPARNIQIGVSMLADLQKQFGRRDLVLAGYNAGPGAVQQYGGIPPYTETRDYVVLADFYRDRYAGVKLSPARVARFKAAWANLVAFYKRICGRP
jgi:soluble lytic murein transglycosylase-like protein